MTQFEKLGFFIEYMIDTKYIGTINIKQPDREEIGYYGRIDSVANQDILLDNNKRIKKGQSYYTRMYPLCGKYINK
jgi:hypothetical protein|tara:strand:+ start:627 stop:854 length:228 start_codon:yes stop_codon:yes gene_type:complete